MTDLLTVAEVAQYLGVSVQRVHQLIAARRLPAERLGPIWVVHPDDLHFVAVRKTGRPPRLDPWPDDEDEGE